MPTSVWLLVLPCLLAPGLEAAGRRSRRELSPGLHRAGLRDPGGSYCRRLGSCCPGRDDACTVPYIDTICYCDLFCNRTVSDCCPDFWPFCLGTRPPFHAGHGKLQPRAGWGGQGGQDGSVRSSRPLRYLPLVFGRVEESGK